MKRITTIIFLMLAGFGHVFGSNLSVTHLHLDSLTIVPPPAMMLTDKSFAKGIFGWDATGHPPITESNPLVNSANIDGWRVKTRWSDIQTGPSTFNWSQIDNSITVAQNHGKKILLSVSAGRNCPAFIFAANGGNCTPIVLTYKQTNDSTTPLCFDPAYWAYWDAFVTTLAARYDGNPAIAGVYLTGHGPLSLEFVVARQTTDIAAWNARAVAAGYADKSAGLRAGFQHVAGTFHAVFIHTPCEVTTAQPWGGGAFTGDSTADLNFCVAYWEGLSTMRGDCSEQFHATQTHANTGLILSPFRTHGQETVDSMHGRLGLGIYSNPQPVPLPADPTPIDDTLRAMWDDGVQHAILFQEDLVPTPPFNQATITADRLLILSNSP